MPELVGGQLASSIIVPAADDDGVDDIADGVQDGADDVPSDKKPPISHSDHHQDLQNLAGRAASAERRTTKTDVLKVVVLWATSVFLLLATLTAVVALVVTLHDSGGVIKARVVETGEGSGPAWNGIILYVRETLTGLKFSVRLPSSSPTIRDVKAQIKEEHGIPPEKQTLTFGGQQLEDGRTLSHYNIQSEDTIELTVAGATTATTDGFELSIGLILGIISLLLLLSCSVYYGLKKFKKKSGPTLNMTMSQLSANSMTGSRLEMTGSRTGMTGSRTRMTGSRSGMTGSRIDMSGSRSGMTGSRIEMTGSRTDMTGSRTGMTGSRIGMTRSSNEMSRSMTQSQPNVYPNDMTQMYPNDMTQMYPNEIIRSASSMSRY